MRPGQPDTSDLPGRDYRPRYRRRRILDPSKKQPVVQQNEIEGGGEHRSLPVENRRNARKIGAGLEDLAEQKSEFTVRAIKVSGRPDKDPGHRTSHRTSRRS